MAQDKEKGKLEENRSKVIDRTKAIIEQAGKMRNAPVGARFLPQAPFQLRHALLPCTCRHSRRESLPTCSALHEGSQAPTSNDTRACGFGGYSRDATMLAGRPGQKPNEETGTARKEADEEMQDANAEQDEHQPQEHEDVDADGEAEDAAHAGGHTERDARDFGKVHCRASSAWYPSSVML